MKKGYSIIAYIDHDIFIPHNELSDDNFLALNGFEMEITEEGKPWPEAKCCHICYIALDKEKFVQPMWNEKYLFGNAPKYKHLVKYDGNEELYIRKYNGEAISEMMKIGRDKGFFVTYNHPAWSKESYPEYINYSGMNAMEMFNGGCISEGYEDYNPRVYDDILASGKRIYCIGADDNHNAFEVSSCHCDSGLAFTVIKADNLEYETITKALADGNFYCSDGPSIYELWVEDDKIHIECSEAYRIICTYKVRNAGIAYQEEGEKLTSATFDFKKEQGYARITVIDKDGKRACTNAYFID